MKKIIETTDYGTNEIGVPYRSEGQTWFRNDIYRSSSGEVNERRFAAGPEDQSPMARNMYAGKGNCHYDPNCSCCWLGFSHTLDYHNKNIKAGAN